MSIGEVTLPVVFLVKFFKIVDCFIHWNIMHKMCFVIFAYILKEIFHAFLALAYILPWAFTRIVSARSFKLCMLLTPFELYTYTPFLPPSQPYKYGRYIGVTLSVCSSVRSCPLNVSWTAQPFFFFYQTWYGGVLSWGDVSCRKLGSLSPMSRSQRWLI